MLVAAGGLLWSSEAQTAEAAAEGSALFLPSGYEQYLALEKPVDVAMSEEHIAIADGASLYLYDREAGVYTLYRHKVQSQEQEQEVNISKVQFTPDGRLFFSDADSHLFLYDFGKGTAAMQSNVICATFFIDGDTLYAASVTNTDTSLYAFDHRKPGLDFSQDARRIGVISNSVKTPCLFVLDGVLYSAADGIVHYCAPPWDKPIPLTLAGKTSVQNLTSVAVFGGNVYYTVSGSTSSEEDGLYRAVLDESSELILAGSGYNALTVYGGNLYCVKGNTVRELKEEDGKLLPTGYEIASSSDSVNRLSGAKDTVRARDLLVTSDCGNERVSVCDLSTGKYSILDTGAASHVATDGDVIAASVGNTVKLYRYGEKTPYYEHTAANNVTGISVVFGRCYYVSEHHYGVAEEGFEEFTRSNSPTALTSDVFGNLYVADQQLHVTKYTEAEFLDPEAEGTPAQYSDADGTVTELRLPEGYLSLRADFDGNLYYLYENALYCNGARIKPADTGEYVYRKEGSPLPQPVSFALGYEDNGIYFQYGDYIVLDGNVTFPTLSTILSVGAHKDVFSTPNGETVSLTDVRAGATGIGVDAGGLGNETPYFPYAGYARTTGGRAVVLCRRDKFCFTALYENYEYKVALFRAEDCTDVSPEWSPSAPKTQYVTSEVALSYFPCLTQPLTIERLPRATEVTVYGTLQSAGFEFAYVLCGEKWGYLPINYLTESSPIPPEAEEYYIGYLKASDEGVTFHSAVGDLLVKDETVVKVYEKSNGLCRVTFEKDGVEYYTEVTKNMLRTGNPDTLRISLIIVLSVVAVGIVTAYIVFLPRRKKD